MPAATGSGVPDGSYLFTGGKRYVAGVPPGLVSSPHSERLVIAGSVYHFYVADYRLVSWRGSGEWVLAGSTVTTKQSCPSFSIASGVPMWGAPGPSAYTWDGTTLTLYKGEYEGKYAKE